MQKKMLAVIFGATLAALPLTPAVPVLQVHAQEIASEAGTDENIASGAGTDENITSEAGTDENIASEAGTDENTTSGAGADENTSGTGTDENTEEPDTSAIRKYADTMVYARNLANGIRLHWNRMEGVDGYIIYRKENASGKYRKIKTIDSDNILYWTNVSVDAGHRYYYKVKGYLEGGEEGEAEAAAGDTRKVLVRMEPVSLEEEGRLPSEVRASSAGRLLTWTTDETASGYEIETADNRFFRDAESYRISGSETGQMELADIYGNKEIYVRIRTIGKKGKTSSVSAWSYSSNVKEDKTVSRRYWKNKSGSRIEIKSAAGQKLYGYDTIQGGCSDGTYVYEALYNRTANKSRIVRMRISDGKVLKKSGALNLRHANDMTYNPDTGLLAVIHYTNEPKRVSMVDAKTLKVKSFVEVQIPDTLYGATEKQLKSIKGFTGIAYDAENKRYVLAVKGTKELLVCDENLVPLRLMKTASNGYTNQGLACTGEYIIRAQSGKTNLLSIYDWDGNLLADLDTGKSWEMEQVFFAGGRLFTGYYSSGYTKKKVRINKKTVTRAYLYRRNYIAEMLLSL